jgi:hypothetical protein
VGLQAEALQEAVVALRTHRVAGEQVQRGDLGRLAAQRGLGVLADQDAGLVVVGGKQASVRHRVGGAVQRDHLHALGLRLLDRRQDGLAAGVIRMVLAPAATMFSIAVTWPALSPSVLPAAVISLAPSFLASAWAPSFIFTKKGLVSVLVIRPITGSAAHTLKA